MYKNTEDLSKKSRKKRDIIHFSSFFCEA